MNINANELLLLQNKKLKLKSAENTSPVIQTPTQEPNAPQTGLNALMFKAISNVASNPQLAKATGFMKEAETQNTDDKANSSNVAFQGKFNKATAMVALASWMAVAPLVSSLQSCTIESEQIVNVDLTALLQSMNNIEAALNELKEQNKISQELQQQTLAYMQLLYEQVKNGDLKESEFYDALFKHMVIIAANQELIINQLVANGKTEEEAKEAILTLIDKFDKGLISAEAAWAEIQKLLGQISGQLGDILAAMDKAEKDRAELLETAKAIKESGELTNAQNDTLIAQNKELIESNKGVIAKLDSINTAIVIADVNNTAKLDDIAKAINMSKDEIIGVMKYLGYQDAQIEMMTAAQIKAAIKENTVATKETNNKLQVITTKLELGLISGKEAADEILSLLGTISDSLQIVISQLKDIYKNDVKSSEALDKIYAQTVENGNLQAEANELLVGLQITATKYGEEGKQLGAQLLQYIAAVGFDMNMRFSELLAAVQEGNLKFDDAITLLANLKAIEEQNGQDTKALYQAVCALGFDMNVQTNKILEVVLADKENGEAIQTLLTKVLTQLAKMDNTDREEHKEVITAIQNIKVTGGNIDLGSVETMLDDLKGLLEENNQLLSNLNIKADVLNVTTKAIEEKMADEYGKNDIRYTNIMNVLEAIKANSGKYDDSALLGKLDGITGNLDEIKALIEQHNKDHKDHEIKVTVDVTGKVKCECDCQHTTSNPNEGVLGDLEDILNNN